MQFTIITIISVLAASGFAAPTRDTFAGNAFMRRSCDIEKCAAALGPAAVSCTLAALKKGTDPSKDASCIAAVANNVENTPAACQPCIPIAEKAIGKAAKSVKNTAKSALGSAESGAKKALGAAEGAVSKVGDAIGSIF